MKRSPCQNDFFLHLCKFTQPMDACHALDATYYVCNKCSRPFLRERGTLDASLCWMKNHFPEDSIEQVKKQPYDPRKGAKDMGTISHITDEENLEFYRFDICNCWKEKWEDEKGPLEKFMERRHIDWFRQVVEPQLSQLTQDQEEVNIILSHRHHYTRWAGKPMHISLFPPEAPQGLHNRWDLFLPHFLLFFGVLSESVPNSTRKNIFLGSNEGPIIGFLTFREMMTILSEKYGQNLPFDFSSLTLFSYVNDGGKRFEQLKLPDALSKREFEGLVKGFPRSQTKRQCEWIKANGERCGNRQKHAFCWRHN